MAQKITGYVKLQIPAGKATPAPPVGPALGQHGVNIAAFTKEFNERTKNDMGMIIPVVITVYADRSFSFITKTPPAAVLIKKECNIESGSGVPNKTNGGRGSCLACGDLQFHITSNLLCHGVAPPKSMNVVAARGRLWRGSSAPPTFPPECPAGRRPGAPGRYSISPGPRPGPAPAPPESRGRTWRPSR